VREIPRGRPQLEQMMKKKVKVRYGKKKRKKQS